MDAFLNQYAEQVRELVKASNRVAELGYVSSHGGNLSVRVGENAVLITPTKVAKRDITEEDICLVDMQGNTLFAPAGRKPTSETPFHLRVYQKRPDLKGIVHAHPPILTGFAIAGGDILRKPILPEPSIEVGPMVMVPYAQPGSDALAEAFDGPLEKSNGFLMENHGVLMTNNIGVMRALDLLEMMEACAKSVLVAKMLGNLKPLTVKDVQEAEEVMISRGLPMPGAPGLNKKLSDVFDL